LAYPHKDKAAARPRPPMRAAVNSKFLVFIQKCRRFSG
jgi:hypothetical protein